MSTPFSHAAAALDAPPPAPPPTPVEERILAALGGVIDPEIGLDVVTLGLVYDVRHDAAHGTAHVTYTLTTPGCPMSGVIGDGLHAAVAAVPGVQRVEAELVWEPRWHAGMIREGAW